MAAVVIPTRTDVGTYSLRVDLSGVEYLLEFSFNQREGLWYLGVHDQLGDPIVQGVKIVLGFPLMREVSDVRRPLGDFIALDTERSGVEAGLTDLGDRVLLLYEDGT